MLLTLRCPLRHDDHGHYTTVRHAFSREGEKRWLSAVQPTPHTGSTEDIGPLAVLLSGKGSDYITGQTIMIDGGASSSAVWPFEP